MLPRSAPLPSPTLVTKNVMFGDCGGCGADGCCAPALEIAPRATTATTDGFSFFIVVSSQKSSCPDPPTVPRTPEDPIHSTHQGFQRRDSCGPTVGALGQKQTLDAICSYGGLCSGTVRR